MSLRQAATQAAAADLDKRRAAATEARAKELADRKAYVVKQFHPLATESDVTMTQERLKVPFLSEKSLGDIYGSRTVHDVVDYDGTVFRVDDVDVFVWRKDYRELLLSVLVSCVTCAAHALPRSYSTPITIQVYARQDDARRDDLTKAIGDVLSKRWLCASHTAAKVNARCEMCRRPFAEDL